MNFDAWMSLVPLNVEGEPTDAVLNQTNAIKRVAGLRKLSVGTVRNYYKEFLRLREKMHDE